MREAEITISESEYEAMGIGELVSLCREAGQREFEELACHGNGAVVQVEVETRLDEGRLDDLEYVDQWERVTDTEGAYLYVIGFTAPDLSADITEYAEDLVGTCDPDVDEDGTTLSLVGSQEAIRGSIGEYVDSGVSPDLRKLGEYDGPTRPMEQLTDRQREILRVAFEEGYYEVPREASTEDVAAEVGVDPSTVAEHLQRAERNLLTQFLSTGT
ncbi:helix-turn-helix domain-containing protein [Halosimplex amylolyticum]|uniref:helix-turn-helix domain-containing protein n=1 Tax=Halosimplex amylolyticum TaxID=3396616 RepID=UPI003F575720